VGYLGQSVGGLLMLKDVGCLLPREVGCPFFIIPPKCTLQALLCFEGWGYKERPITSIANLCLYAMTVLASELVCPRCKDSSTLEFPSARVTVHDAERGGSDPGFFLSRLCQ